MVFIDGSAVNVILPVLQNDLHATAIELQWVVVGYTLFLASLMLAGGALGDRLGRRRIFVTGAIAFAVASACCGVASSAGMLVAARAIQGVGSALLTPGSLALIGASFDEKRRAWAIGVWSSATAITAALGPGFGGWLAQAISWRAIFFINLPLAAAVVIISLLRVPESDDGESAKGIDWIGAALCTVGLGLIAYALTFAAVLGWSSPSVLIALVAGCAMAIAFVFVERSVKDPMLPLGLFASKTFSGVNALTFALYAALSGVLYFLPFRLIQVDGYSPAAAGFSLLPFVLLIFSLSPVFGSLVQRIGARPLLVAGPLCAAVACAMFGAVPSGKPYVESYLWPMIVMGVGMAMAVAPLTATVMTSVDARHVGLASGVNNAMSRIAGLFAVAALGSLLLAVFSSTLDARLRAAPIAPPVRQAAMDGRLLLAQDPVPSSADPVSAAAARVAIRDSYLHSLQVVMDVCAGLAALGAAAAALTVDRKRA